MEGPLSESDQNKRRGGRGAATIRVIPWAIKSGLDPVIHQETISGRPEQKCFPSDQDWNDLKRGYYLSQTQINAGGQNAATIQIISWTIFEVRPGSFARYCTHQKTLSGTPE